MDVSLRSPDVASSRSGWSPRDRASPTAADGGTSGSDRAAVVTGVGASFTFPVPDDTDRAVTPRACSGKGNRALLVVSAVSAWEITTKRLLGKLPQEVASGSCLRPTFCWWPIQGTSMVSVPSDCPVAEDHALLAGRLDWDHRDPFDRMIAAQAMIESVVISTGDPAFAHCHGVPTPW